MRSSTMGTTLLVITLVALTATPAPVRADGATAEVWTWAGQSVVLSEPVFEARYNVLTEKGRLGTAPAGEAVAAGEKLELSGTLEALSTFLDKKIESRWARRDVAGLTVRRGGVETRVPVETIRSVAFTRERITRNPLPVYHAPRHFRHGAIIVLQDGSSLEGDYVNLGTAVLTGMTPQGRVEIPWEEIEMVRFRGR